MRVFTLVATIMLLSACASTRSRRAELPWAAAQQLVLVVTPDWNATHGTLQRYSRRGDDWREEGAATTVVIGRSGAAWGIGLHPVQNEGPSKREGDGRSPAGVFAIGTAFGYAPSEPLAMPYRALDAGDYCIDDSGSAYYNRIVAQSDVGADAVAASTEPMRRDLHVNGDDAYKIGFVVEHNPRGAPGGGSCIFVHLWKTPDTPTSGCTALAEPALRDLLGWLQPRRQPVFVLLPESEYRRLRAAWQLPDGAGS